MKRAFLLWVLLATMTAVQGANGVLEQPDPNRPLRVRQTVDPVFPQSLLNSGVMNGHARVVLDIDVTGKLTDWLVVAYSNPEFGDAAMFAVRRWEFFPLYINGNAVACQVTIGFRFEAKGVVVSISPGVIPWLPMANEYRPCTPDELDRIPLLLTPVDPRNLGYTREMQEMGVTGSATVEFYIDETGAVRMPAVVAADFPELGGLAVLAVRQWAFEVPTARGRPVLAHVQQRFDFKKAEEAATE